MMLSIRGAPLLVFHESMGRPLLADLFRSSEVEVVWPFPPFPLSS